MQFTFDSMIDSQINFDTILSHFTQWAGGTQAFDWLIFVQNHGWQGRGGYKFLTEKIYSGEEILRSVLPRSDYNFTLDIHE